MRERIKSYLAERGIEYFALLDYRDCIETGAEIAARAGFAPRSAVVYLAPYYAGGAENISAYASSLDYHIFLRETGDGLAALIRESYPEAACKSYGDHSPIAECHAALIGGLGIIGDSGLLINEKYGTYVFVGDLITDLDPGLLGAARPLPISSCSHCGACKKACPTGILRGEGEDCLSAITQKKGELSSAECELMQRYNTAWGCDLCQSSCPHNRKPRLTPIEFFHRDRISSLDKERIEGMSKAEFNLRAFAWRGRRTVLRNLDVLSGDYVPGK